MLTRLVLSILIFITVGLNTIAQILLKFGTRESYPNLYLFAGVLAYGFSSIFYILVLGKYNLSIAYPVVIGLTVTATTISGAILLKEEVSMVHWMGVGLILSGICTISFNKFH